MLLFHGQKDDVIYEKYAKEGYDTYIGKRKNLIYNSIPKMYHEVN